MESNTNPYRENAKPKLKKLAGLKEESLSIIKNGPLIIIPSIKHYKVRNYSKEKSEFVITAMEDYYNFTIKLSTICMIEAKKDQSDTLYFNRFLIWFNFRNTSIEVGPEAAKIIEKHWQKFETENLK